MCFAAPLSSLSFFLCFPSSLSRIEGPSIRGKGDRGREGGEEKERIWLNAREEELACRPERRERGGKERKKQDWARKEKRERLRKDSEGSRAERQSKENK